MNSLQSTRRHVRFISSLLLSVFLLAPDALIAARLQDVSPSSGRSRVTKNTGNTIRKRTRPSAKKAAPAVPAKEEAATTGAAPKSEGSPVSGQIESYSHKVDVRSGAEPEWKKAQARMALRPADQIRTGSRSVARVKLGDGSKVLLLQNSQAEVENLSSVQKTIRLLRGRVRAIVAKVKGGNNFQIKTPVGVASVRGTDFEVEFLEESQEMEVAVREGQVGVSRLGDLASEVLINPGERLRFGMEGDLGDPIRTGALPLNRQDVRSEIQIAQAKDAVIAQAAEEMRSADYQVGKSLIDVDGTRVRVEEYITRPAANEFKLVALNERPNRFDYFTYKGTFNQSLPEDLSVALRQVNGKLGSSAPDYYLTGFESVMSNTVDSITESGQGGHLVEIRFDGTNYQLIDAADSTHTRTIAAAELISGDDYRVYNPIKDQFVTVKAANLSEALKISVLDSGTNAYRNLANGDIYWKSRYNTYSNSVVTPTVTKEKTGYTVKAASVRTLAIDLDANFSNRPISTISEYPSGAGNLHNRLSIYYSDESKIVYDNYVIDDEGGIGPASRFAGISTSAEYKSELEKWNYQTKVSADEMQGRSINLVIDPRIGTMSGLIQ